MGMGWKELGFVAHSRPLSAGHMDFPNGQVDKKETSDGTYLDSVPARNALASKGNERVTRTSGKKVGGRAAGGREAGSTGKGSITAVQEHPARLDRLIPRLFLSQEMAGVPRPHAVVFPRDRVSHPTGGVQ